MQHRIDPAAPPAPTSVVGVLIQLHHVLIVQIPRDRDYHRHRKSPRHRIGERVQNPVHRGQIEMQGRTVPQLDPQRSFGQRGRILHHRAPVVRMQGVDLQRQRRPEPDCVDRRQHFTDRCQFLSRLTLVVDAEEHLVEHFHHLFPGTRADRIPEHPLML